MKRNGFSLVELSIVLVILGLLVGGILAGRSLIRASELRGAAAEATKFITATAAFRDKYFALPGDMANATSIWGSISCSTATPSGSTATCNGDGDGKLGGCCGAGGIGNERFRYWQQLSNAGMIEGFYTGYGISGGNTTSIGLNVPASELNPGGWTAMYIGNQASSGLWWAGTNGNVLFLGAQSTTYNDTVDPLMKAEEAWNIDTKMDDGMPAHGKVRPWANGTTNCVTNNTSSAVYRVDNTTNGCQLSWLRIGGND